MNAPRRKSTSDVATASQPLSLIQQTGRPMKRRRSTTAAISLPIRHPAKKPAPSRLQPSSLATRSTGGINKLRRKPRTDLRLDLLASRIDSLNLEPTQASIDSLINPMSNMQVSTDPSPPDILPPLTLPHLVYRLPPNPTPRPPQPVPQPAAPTLLPPLPSPYPSPLISPVTTPLSAVSTRATLASMVSAVPAPPRAVRTRGPTFEITFHLPMSTASNVVTTRFSSAFPLVTLPTRAATLVAFRVLLITQISHSARLRRRAVPAISRLVFRVEREGLERSFILDGLDNGGVAGAGGSQRRDVWEDGEAVYRGFLEGCGLVSSGGGGGEEGARASTVVFGGARWIKAGGGEVEGGSTAEKGPSVESATSEVEFGEGKGLLEMRLDDLRM